MAAVSEIFSALLAVSVAEYFAGTTNIPTFLAIYCLCLPLIVRNRWLCWCSFANFRLSVSSTRVWWIDIRKVSPSFKESRWACKMCFDVLMTICEWNSGSKRRQQIRLKRYFTRSDLGQSSGGQSDSVYSCGKIVRLARNVCKCSVELSQMFLVNLQRGFAAKGCRFAVWNQMPLFWQETLAELFLNVWACSIIVKFQSFAEWISLLSFTNREPAEVCRVIFGPISNSEIFPCALYFSHHKIIIALF